MYSVDAPSLIQSDVSAALLAVAVQRNDPSPSDNRRRASLVSQIIDPLNTPFKPSTSFLNSSPVRETPWPVTSLKRQDLLRAYPSLVSNLRWNPYVETSSDVQTKQLSCDPIQPEEGMSNRTCFNNQCTMTTHEDVSSSKRNTVPSRTQRNDAGVSAQPVRTPHRCNNLYNPEAACPSFQKMGKRCEEMGKCVPRRRTRPCEPIRDFEEISEPTSPFYNESPGQRRMIYNEGISDEVTTVHRCTHQPACMAPVRWPDNYIPYGHYNKSKYHNNCLDEPPVRCRGGCSRPEPVQQWSQCSKSMYRRPELVSRRCSRTECCHSPPPPPAPPQCNHHQLLCADRKRDIPKCLRYRLGCSRSPSSSRNRRKCGDGCQYECSSQSRIRVCH